MAQTSWSIIWTTISFGLNLGGVLYHPGIDIAFEIISIGLAFGMVWILIWWVDTIKRYGYSCYPSQDDCTETKGEALIASQIIASILILLSGYVQTVPNTYCGLTRTDCCIFFCLSRRVAQCTSSESYREKTETLSMSLTIRQISRKHEEKAVRGDTVVRS